MLVNIFIIEVGRTQSNDKNKMKPIQIVFPRAFFIFFLCFFMRLSAYNRAYECKCVRKRAFPAFKEYVEGF